FTLGIRLADQPARIWQTNLWQLASGGRAGQPVPVTLDRQPGWDQSMGSNGLRLVRAEGWVLLASGPQRSNNVAKAIARLMQKQSLRPEGLNGWLTLEADLPLLSAWLPIFRTFPLPPVRLAIMGEGENLRTRGSFQLAKPLPWKFEPWKIPTNSVDENLVSFTVGQGMETVLKDRKWVKGLGLSKIPNQFVMWGVPAMLSQTILVAPIEDATNTIRKLAATAPKVIESLVGPEMGNVLYASNSATILWQRFPAISPHIRPLMEAGQEYLMGAMFPLARRTNHPPQELFAQLAGRTNIAYYDWEVTEPRIVQARQLFTLQALINRRKSPSADLPVEKWLYDLSPLVGNAVTEVTVTGPKELSLLRKSQVGLTGFELVSLVRWIDSPGFPLTFELPPRVERPPPKQP
ncbi:MAG TPA: hypothetical protein VK633_13490, partial [Verrucomicrobiae bacterium]|nr:hypothetical protein [Verrucomicrobiae bacterium]